MFTKEEEDKVKSILEKSAADLIMQVKAITDPLDAKLKQIEEGFKANGVVDPTLKEEVKNLAQKHQEVVAKLDDRLAELKTINNYKGGEKDLTFKSQIKSAFYEKGASNVSFVDRIKANKGKKEPIEIELKAVGDMSAANLTGTYFTGYDLRPGVIGPMYDAHLRPLFAQGTTERDTIRFVKETGMEGGFDTVAPGAMKPQIDWDFSIQDAPVRKIAGWFRLPEEMIQDIPYLLGYLTTRGLEELYNTEDNQFLYGDGEGDNLKGINEVASPFAAGGLANKITLPNYFDVLVAAKAQLRRLNLIPTGAVVSPDDYAVMRLMKTTTGEYVFPVIPGTNVISVDGTPIVQNNRVNTGSFFMMDARYAQVLDRTETSVRLYDQDRDNAVKNLITCVIEERLAFPIYRPQAIVKGDFDSAAAALAA